MSDTDISEVASFARKTLRDSSPNKVRGGQLSVLIKTNFPDLNLQAAGFRNLRDFIAKTVPSVIEAGRAGTDILYAHREEQQSLFAETGGTVSGGADRTMPVQQLLDNPKIWRTFASPDSHYRLYLLPDGRLRVLRPSEIAEPTWFQIPPVSGETLLQIGKDFVSDLPEAQRAPLVKYLAEPNWWIPFFEALRDVGLKGRWIVFRRRRIVAEFERALMNAPAVLGTDTARSVEDEELSTWEGRSAPSVGSSLLRRIAIAAVARMTEGELRSLSLPLGYVVDALPK